MENNKRPDSMERITTKELADAFIEEQVKALQEQVGDSTAHQGGWKTARLRACESWFAAKGRAGAGGGRVPQPDGRESDIRGRG